MANRWDDQMQFENMLTTTSVSRMSQERKLKVRPVPPAAKGGPFRAYVSAQVLELFGGKSETAAWVLGNHPVPVTLWREQPPAKGGKQEQLGNNVIQLSETVRQMGGLKLEDPITLLREESAWVPNAGKVLLEESEPQTNGHTGSDTERKELEDRIRRQALKDPVYHALFRQEVAVCGQQVEAEKSTFTVRQVDSSQAGGLHWITEDTQVQIVPKRKQEMKISRERIGGLTSQIEQLDRILRDHYKTPPTRIGPCEHVSNFVLLTGPTGGGKTTLIKALERLSWPKVFRVSTDPRSQTKIRTVMNDARHFRRALIVIDDIGFVAAPEKGNTHPNAFVTDLLRSISEVRKDQNTRILLVAATQDPEDVHARLRQPSGFNKIIRCGLPKIQARQDILSIRLAGSGVPEEAVAEIARQTHAFSGFDLWALVAELTKISSHAALDRLPRSSSLGSLSDTSDHTAKDWLVYAEQALREVRPTTMQGLHVEVPETRFSDIGGQAGLKARLERELREPILHPERYTRYKMRPMKGLLMYGPPGCSKTLMARALATEFGLNFLLVNASELISSYVGESEKRLRELFQQARDASPSILFFDEFETLGAARGGKDSHGGLNIVQTLLTEMDGVKPLENVFVLAATNRPEILDPAVLRPGRLHPHVLIGLPDLEARKEIIYIKLKELPEDFVRPELMENLVTFATRTEGLTGAQMVELVEEAVKSAWPTKLTSDHFEKALKSVHVNVTEDIMAGYRDWKAQ